MKKIKITLVLMCIVSLAQSQISQGGSPYSFSSPIADSIAAITMASVDVAALLAENELEVAQGIAVPFRFGYPFDISLGLNKALRT